jgi:hypothetical protein
MITIRTFRAIDDLDSCKQFAEGHAKVLLDYGVSKVTSSSTAWFENPSVYVMIAEMAETGETVGGIRIHIADGKTDLPMEDAISIVDKRVYDMIKRYTANGTGELCGLWNSKSTSGLGIGSYLLMRAGISAGSTLHLTTLFALCAPHTLKISVEKGFEVEKSIGKAGTFVYPKLDLIATSIVIKDLKNLPLSQEKEREIIFELRKNPRTTRTEEGPKGNMEVSYDLLFEARNPV